MRRSFALLASLALVLSMAPAVAVAAPSSTGAWIVTLRADVDARTAAPALAKQHSGTVGYVYQHAINGFSLRASGAAAAALARNPQVTLVEADAAVWLDDTQIDPTWGLDRIDQRALPLSKTYTYDTTGNGVTAYVIDSGIRTSHDEFDQGRATASAEADFINDGQDGQDCNGHGTHVAGTIGGKTYGVAKAVDLVSVRVFGCSGGSSWSTIIAGVDWVTQYATKPAVANLSLGGGGSFSVDNAVKGMIASGVGAAVAAGNSGANACNYSPARVGDAMTIGATTSADAKSSWSNYGSCIDWFAPGSSIKSAGITDDGSTATKSGTSMAAPHTAGVAALFLEANPSATPAQVRTELFDATSKGVVTSSSTTNNHLLYSGFIAKAGGGTAVPTAAFAGSPTLGTSPLSVAFTDQSTNSPTTWSWDFGDGTGSADQHPIHTYAAGTYTVTLTVSNSAGPDTETKVDYIRVSSQTNGAIALSVAAYKVKGLQKADLTWSGVISTTVDVFRNGTKITTTANDGAYTDNINNKGGGSYTYQVCEAGSTSACSNEATASY